MKIVMFVYNQQYYNKLRDKDVIYDNPKGRKINTSKKPKKKLIFKQSIISLSFVIFHARVINIFRKICCFG